MDDIMAYLCHQGHLSNPQNVCMDLLHIDSDMEESKPHL